MKKVSIKRISLRGIFFGIISLIGVPMGILAVIMILGSMGSNGDKGMIMGSLCMILIAPIIYGGVGMIFGLSYNLLSPKIGCFKIELEDEEEDQEEEIKY
ncbi:MAG: hypothetical protein RSA01_03695 [Clostridium sp.]